MRTDVYESYCFVDDEETEVDPPPITPDKVTKREIQAWAGAYIAAEGEVISRWTLEEEPELFLHLANLRLDPIAFVSSFGIGMLPAVFHEKPGLKLLDWAVEAMSMFFVLRACSQNEAIAVNCSKPLAQQIEVDLAAARLAFAPSPKSNRTGDLWMTEVAVLVNTKLNKFHGRSLGVKFARYPDDAEFVWGHGENLFGTCWGQLADALANGRRILTCENCTEFFIPGRTNQVHCSAKCRTAAYRARGE